MRTIIALSLSLFTLFSCDQPTLEEEMDAYCECIHDDQKGSDHLDCLILMQDISDKYAFDPEASEEIEQRVNECRVSR